ncbi:MAG: UDP-N-acetylmuramate dehydrogenase [Acutalibacteraceae bacterium]|nr:UDP-N-acetylmuramate dehydrogenase [Clostridia bacterium]MEE3450261.1 UDP-N-acetylmuramate dehydrogenase [Acutalibacteraceae bacterium]
MEKNINIVIDKAKELGCEVLINEPLSRYTTFRVGGAAAALIKTETTESLSILFALCNKLDVRNFVIGNGSNLLVNDNGYDGIVFKLEGEFTNIYIDDENIIRCGAGATLAKLCKFAAEHNLSGLEFAWGIPGTVGGAAFMNAGAYGGEMKDVVASSSYIDKDGNPGTIDAGELDFSYRHSVYSDNGFIITGVTFKLTHDNAVEINHRMDDFLSRRKEKQPLNYPSAGSVFKRPGKEIYVGKLVQDCGLKGKQIGGAQVSEKHAGFIINKSNATCADVCSLIEYVQNVVLEEKGVKLECEIRRI